jgi:hypothetical protein
VRRRRLAPRTLALAAAFAAVLLPLAAPALAQPSEPPEKAAKAQMAEGDRAFREKDFVTALTAYRAATKAETTLLSVEGVASAAYALGRSAESHDAYALLLERFGKLLSPKARDTARARLTELAAKTALLTITVSLPGAEVRVDGELVGTSPLAAARRVDAGARKVSATRDGFVPLERAVEIRGGTDAAVELRLEAIAVKGHVVIRESDGRVARVRIDGKEVGPAPWQGDLDAGPHEIALVSDEGTATTTLDVVKGTNPALALSTAAPAARLEVRTSDGLGSISLDGKVVGQGSFAGDVPAGKHVLRVTRDGFEPYERSVELEAKHTLAEIVTLKNAQDDGAAAKTDAAKPSAPAAEDDFSGLYGGVTLLGAFVPFGSGSDPELRCTDIGASECTSPSSAGGGLLGYLGYFGDPLGVELAAGALFDQTSSTATYTGQGTGNPLSIGVPRTADFDVYRVGPVAALRLRASAHGPQWLVTAAAGPGLAQKTVFLARNSTSTDGRNLTNDFVPDELSYVSPALSFELAAGYRVSPGFSLLVGGYLWLETAQEDLHTAPDGQAYLSNGDVAVPLVTPSYRPASGTQVFLGPFLSAQFGP